MHKVDQYTQALSLSRNSCLSTLANQSTRNTQDDPYNVILPDFSISISQKESKELNVAQKYGSPLKEEALVAFTPEKCYKGYPYAKEMTDKDYNILNYVTPKPLHSGSLSKAFPTQDMNKFRFRNCRLRRLAGVDHGETRIVKKQRTLHNRTMASMVKSIKLLQRGSTASAKKRRFKMELRDHDKPQKVLPVCRKGFKVRKPHFTLNQCLLPSSTGGEYQSGKALCRRRTLSHTRVEAEQQFTSKSLKFLLLKAQKDWNSRK
ncbi:unnamed protein product [Moneuplotes crassus]|uniref:Uncharacterized protein n=1 Tax=Euplotes crassus TaxID=5936 RepID=A0AAD1XI22_EUPCR|nr:unnamed protein product [Moneuplotes crassus]